MRDDAPVIAGIFIMGIILLAEGFVQSELLVKIFFMTYVASMLYIVYLFSKLR